MMTLRQSEIPWQTISRVLIQTPCSLRDTLRPSSGAFVLLAAYLLSDVLYLKGIELFPFVCTYWDRLYVDVRL